MPAGLWDVQRKSGRSKTTSIWPTLNGTKMNKCICTRVAAVVNTCCHRRTLASGSITFAVNHVHYAFMCLLRWAWSLLQSLASVSILLRDGNILWHRRPTVRMSMTKGPTNVPGSCSFRNQTIMHFVSSFLNCQMGGSVDCVTATSEVLCRLTGFDKCSWQSSAFRYLCRPQWKLALTVWAYHR